MGRGVSFLINLYLKLFRSRFLSRWTVLLIDLLIIFSSTVVAYLIVQKVYSSFNVFFPAFWTVAVEVFIINLLYFLIFNTYKGIIRYSTLYEVRRMLYCQICSAITFFILLKVIIGGVSGSITLIFSIVVLSISTFLLLGSRVFIVFGYKKYLSINGRKEKSVSVFIYGTGPDSVFLSQGLALSQGSYRQAGFITSDKSFSSQSIGECPIEYVSKEDISALQKYSIKSILFPNKNVIQEERELVEVLLNNKFNVLLLPKFKDINDLSKFQFSDIRPVQIEDLLGRKEIKISTDIISNTIQGKRILVTGAAGSIGSEIVRQLSKFYPEVVICFDIAETPLNDLDLELKEDFKDLQFITVIGDVRSQERLEMIFKRYNPDIVYHAAAYKHVPMMERNPCEAIMTNVYGTKLVADLSIQYNIEKFVMVSTDKAVNPTNIMGTSKRLAEIYIQSLAQQKSTNSKNIKFITTRFGNVLGSNGSVIPLFRKQLAHGGPITVTHPEITRYFMTIPEACRLVLEASAIGKTGHIYVFDMGEPVKILDLATKMIELAGLRPNVDIKIKFSGLRPGEKLYEELLNDSELVIPTDHEKILIAKVRQYDYEEIRQPIEKLIQYSREVDIPRVVVLMKDIVPEYISKNSEYSKYDKIGENI